MPGAKIKLAQERLFRNLSPWPPSLINLLREGGSVGKRGAFYPTKTKFLRGPVFVPLKLLLRRVKEMGAKPPLQNVFPPPL